MARSPETFRLLSQYLAAFESPPERLMISCAQHWDLMDHKKKFKTGHELIYTDGGVVTHFRQVPIKVVG